jgi:hypothetical protein
MPLCSRGRWAAAISSRSRAASRSRASTLCELPKRGRGRVRGRGEDGERNGTTRPLTCAASARSVDAERCQSTFASLVALRLRVVPAPVREDAGCSRSSRRMVVPSRRAVPCVAEPRVVSGPRVLSRPRVVPCPRVPRVASGRNVSRCSDARSVSRVGRPRSKMTVSTTSLPSWRHPRDRVAHLFDAGAQDIGHDGLPQGGLERCGLARKVLLIRVVTKT